MIKKKFTYKKIKNSKNSKNTKKQKNINKNKRFKLKKSKKRKIYKKSNKKKLTKKFKKKYLQNGGDAASDAMEAANKKNQEWKAERARAAKQASNQSAAGSKGIIGSAKNVMKYLTDNPIQASTEGRSAVMVAKDSAQAVGEGAAKVAGMIGIDMAVEAGIQAVEDTTMPCSAEAPGFKQSLVALACSLFEDIGLSMARHGVGGQAVGSTPANDNLHPT